MNFSLRIFTVCFLLTLASLSAPSSSSADVAPRHTTASKIREEWRLASEAIGDTDFGTANHHVVVLEKLKVRFGLENLEEFSLLLLSESQKQLEAGKVSEADVLLRAAKRLSPTSSAVLLRSVVLTRVIGNESVYSLVGQAIKNLPRSPEKMLGYAGGAIYPVLWALTCALYVCFVLCFALELVEMLRGATGFLPVRYRGIVAPPLVATALILPPISGPLWCIFAWSLLAIVILPTRRWLVFASGVVLMLWACLIPFREAMRTWLSDSSVQTMLRVASGALGSGDLHILERLVSERPDDGVAWFYYGKLLRLDRNFDEARIALKRAEAFLGPQSFTNAELGVIEYLTGDTDRAIKLYLAAEKDGLHTADLYFNIGKAYFEHLDTEQSKTYIAKAIEIDEARVKELQSRESILDKFKESKYAVGESTLPLKMVMTSLFHPRSIREPSDFQAARIMSGSNPILIGIFGILLMTLALFRKVGRAKTRFQMYFENFTPWETVTSCARVFPGGAWIRVGQTGRGVVIACAFMIMAVPLFGWPELGTELFEAFQQLQGLYVGIVSFLVLLTLYFGIQLGED